MFNAETAAIYCFHVQSSRLELRLKIDLTPLCGAHPQDPDTLLSDGTWRCGRRRVLPRLLPFQQNIEQVVLEADVTCEVLVIHA